MREAKKPKLRSKNNAAEQSNQHNANDKAANNGNAKRNAAKRSGRRATNDKVPTKGADAQRKAKDNVDQNIKI